MQIARNTDKTIVARLPTEAAKKSCPNMRNNFLGKTLQGSGCGAKLTWPERNACWS